MFGLPVLDVPLPQQRQQKHRQARVQLRDRGVSVGEAGLWRAGSVHHPGQVAAGRIQPSAVAPQRGRAVPLLRMLLPTMRGLGAILMTHVVLNMAMLMTGSTYAGGTSWERSKL